MAFEGDHDKIQSAANNTAGCLGELENHLTALSNVQDELQIAVQGAAGRAMYDSLSETYMKGKSLAGTLNDIIDMMKKTGISIQASDLEGVGKVLAAAGGDGSVDAGSWSSDASKIKSF